MTCRPTPLSTLACCLIIVLARATPSQAADFGPWMATYELSAKSDVAINPDRLYHGPAAVVAPNGDWLVCFQDSADHGGTDGVIRQVRSRDEGRTWQADGIVHDQREQRMFSRNPAYGVTPDGRIVLVVQRWRPLPAGEEFVLGTSVAIQASVYLISADNGCTYQHQGVVDPAVPLRHQGTTSAIIQHQGRLWMAAVSNNAAPRGISLYQTADPAQGWQFAGWIFPHNLLPSPVYVSYGSLVFRSDGSLLAQCVHYGNNYQRISRDAGRSWGPVRVLKNLGTYKNPDLAYVNGVLVAHGVATPGIGEKQSEQANWNASAGASVVYFSPDEGLSWGRSVILNRYGWRGGGGYSASLRTKSGGLFIVFSTDSGPRTGKQGGKPDVRGIHLTDVEIRRP